jgi:putative transposase
VGEKALVAVVQEAWTGGVSTRRAGELVRATGLAGIGKSIAAKLCKEIDERAGALLDRPSEGERPHLWLDATHLKAREGGRIVPVAAMVAVPVDAEGRREIVDPGLGPSGAGPFWPGFLKGLLRRGLAGVRLVVSDAHHEQTVIAAALRQVFFQPDQDGARQVWRQVADQLRPRRPRLAGLVDEGEADVLARVGFPAQHRAKLRSTNLLKRLDSSPARPRASITRLIGAVLLEQNDEWRTDRRHMQPRRHGRAHTAAGRGRAGAASTPGRLTDAQPSRPPHFHPADERYRAEAGGAAA